MCCPTGLCGTNIDPELMRIAVVVETLKKHGIIVTRHNLRDEPQVYVSNKTVNEHLQKHGADALPITLVDGDLTSSLKKHVFYNWLINTILYLCVI